MKLYPFQETGALWLLEEPHRYLADGMRAGKTVQCVAAINRLPPTEVLVICPAIARQVWHREWKRWSNGLSRPPHVMSYDQLARGHLLRAKPNLLILDEAHMIKSPGAKRTRAAVRIARNTPRNWLLSGTPTPNDASEMYVPMKALWPELVARFANHAAFTEYFCVTAKPFKPWLPRRVVRNRPERAAEMRALLDTFMLRRRLVDVFDELPPLIHEHVEVRSALAANAAMDELFGTTVVREEDLFTWLNSIRQDNAAVVRHAVGVAKGEAVAGLIERELKDGAYRKIVVAAWHHDVMDALVERLSAFGCVRIDGRTGDAETTSRIDWFQREDGPRVLVGQIRKIMMGIDLSAADEIALVEQMWTPEDNAQLTARLLNVGKTRPCRARYYGLAGTIDDRVARALVRKARGIRETLPVHGENQ